MIPGILTVWGFCIVSQPGPQVSPQKNCHHERMLMTIDNLNELSHMVWMRADHSTDVQITASDAAPKTWNYGDQLCDEMETMPYAEEIESWGKKLAEPKSDYPDGAILLSGDLNSRTRDMPALAMPDECEPRLTTVEIPREPNDDINVKLWPPTTRIKRCVGCNPNEVCVAKDTVDRQFMVIVVRFLDSRTSEMMKKFEALRRVAILEHTACDSVCMIRAEDCKLGQQFDDSKCQCRCRVLRKCSSVQRWNSETCRCVCRTCPPGTAVNPETCKCLITLVEQTYTTSDNEEQYSEILNHVEDDDSLENEQTPDYENQNSEIHYHVKGYDSLEKEQSSDYEEQNNEILHHFEDYDSLENEQTSDSEEKNSEILYYAEYFDSLEKEATSDNEEQGSEIFYPVEDDNLLVEDKVKATTADNDPCDASLYCPRFFIGEVQNGKCLCIPAFTSSGFSRK